MAIDLRSEPVPGGLRFVMSAPGKYVAVECEGFEPDDELFAAMEARLVDDLAEHWGLRCSWPGCTETLIGCLIDGHERVPTCGAHMPAFANQPRNWCISGRPIKPVASRGFVIPARGKA